MERKWHVTHVSEIPDAAAPEPGFYAWKPVRRHFDVRSFGINAFVAARAGDWAVEEHDELGETAGRHEELYFVASGRATFRLDDEQLEAAAGTFVFVPDPAVLRSARALEPGTTVLAVGGLPGAAFTVSRWEERFFEGA